MNSGSDEILIVLQPWALTPLPWFLISLAIGLHLYGKKIRIITDDSGSGDQTWPERYQQRSINRVIKLLPNWIHHQKLTDFSKGDETLIDSVIVDRLARKNKTIRYRGEVYPEESEFFEQRTKEALKNTALMVSSVFNDFKPSYIILGGGGYSSSGIWLEVAKANDVRVATIDSGHSILLLSTDGIAANLEDIPRAFAMINEEDEEMIVHDAKKELNKRMTGTDQFNSQSSASTGKVYSYDIIMPLNQSYDLSALERHYVFGSQTEWILETINWVMENSTLSIAIRRHPIERYSIYRSNDDYQKAIRERFGVNERIRFIESDEDVNTYDLMRNAKIVIPYISTVGTEAAALGKIVVSEGASCYADLGFTWTAKSKTEYYDLLGKANEGKLKLTLEQKNNAWKCYYLTQCCNWHHTVFTPQPADFKKWVEYDPEHLLREKSTWDVLYSIDKNVPISIRIHENKKGLTPIKA